MSPNRHEQSTAAISSKSVNLKLARALNPRATHKNTLVMRRSPGLALAKLVTVVAEEPAAVNVYQTVRCRPL